MRSDLPKPPRGVLGEEEPPVVILPLSGPRQTARSQWQSISTERGLTVREDVPHSPVEFITRTIQGK